MLHMLVWLVSMNLAMRIDYVVLDVILLLVLMMTQSYLLEMPVQLETVCVCVCVCVRERYLQSGIYPKRVKALTIEAGLVGEGDIFPRGGGTDDIPC